MSVHEAKAHFSATLKEVEGGETIIVTKHGEAIAKISPVTTRRQPVIGAFEGTLGDMPPEAFAWSEEELFELFGEEYGFSPPSR